MSSALKIKKQNIEDIIPLSGIQEGLLFHYMRGGDRDLYFEQVSISLEGRIEFPLFRKAWETITRTNGMLRTLFRWEKLESPIQIILKDHSIPMREIDLSGADFSDMDRLLEEEREKERARGIDIKTEPLKIALCKTGENLCEMIISSHHILYDGWSTGILLKEFMKNYHALMEGKVIREVKKSSYKDYIKALRRQDKNISFDFWNGYLKGFDNLTALPSEGKKKKTAIFESSEYSFSLPAALAAKVNPFLKEQQITFAAFIYTAWGILLGTYNNRKDVVFGTTVSDRSHEITEIENIVGLFINTIPLRFPSPGDETFSTLLKRTAVDLNEKEDYKSTPLADIHMCSEIKGNLFESIVVVENYPLDAVLLNQDGPVKGTGRSTYAKTNYDLTLTAYNQTSPEFQFLYNNETFSFEDLKRIEYQLCKIMETIILFPGEGLSRLDILSPEDKSVMTRLNNTKTSYPKELALFRIFEKQVEDNPLNIAALHGEESITYKDLNERANKISRFLTFYGVAGGSIVALFLPPSINMLAVIMGILKAGGTYLPLDRGYPAERISRILTDARAPMLLADGVLCKKLFGTKNMLDSEFKGKLIFLDESEDDFLSFSGENYDREVLSNTPAYLMYTSGSTGKPKGILTTHANISRIVLNTNYIDIRKEDIILGLSNYAFDGSTFDIFGALLNGAKLVIPEENTITYPEKIGEIIQKENVSLFFVTTALFNALVDRTLSSLKKVRKVLFGGERVSFGHVKKALEYMGKEKLIHVYGPTETTVFATYYPIDHVNEKLGTVPIGKPVGNTGVYIFDPSGLALPFNASGELYITGEGVAGGYLNRQEVEKERFLIDPHNPGGKMYKTGDLVKMLPDGNILFIDRIDSQVKLRGFRIEPGEIESALVEHENVKEAVVLLGKSHDEKCLNAYLVTDGEVSIEELSSFLSGSLPAYMIPAGFFFTEKMPLTPNGKIDKKALFAYSPSERRSSPYEAPRTPVEKELADLWSRILGTGEIGIKENFFRVGGHSLKASSLASRIHREFDIHLSVQEIFEFPTIEEQAYKIVNTRRKIIDPIPSSEEREFYPLSAAQMMVYVQQQFDGIETAYNMPIALDIKGELDPLRLEECHKELIKRHEALRTSFGTSNGEIVQRVIHEWEWKMEKGDLQNISTKRFLDSFVRPFDLKKAPLIRAALLKNKKKYTLFWDLHHIVADGISFQILIDELFALYNGKSQKAVKINYRDFVLWQEEAFKKDLYREQLVYWKNKLSGELPLLRLPEDFKRGNRRSFTGGTVRFEISGEPGRKLTDLVSDNNMTLNTVFMAFYALLLSRYTNENDLIIGSLISGREHKDLEHTVGMFNNFLPIRINITPEKSIKDFIKEVSLTLGEAYKNREYPYSKIVEEINPYTPQARNPFFDTMLIIHNQLEAAGRRKYGNLSVTPHSTEHNSAKLDLKLDIYAGDKPESFNCIMEYNRDLFKYETIEALCSHFQNLIEQGTSKPLLQVMEIELLSREQRNSLLKKMNDTAADFPSEQTIPQLFDQCVNKYPDETAIIWGEEQVTYSRLNEMAGGIAGQLINNGISTGDTVALFVDRSPEMSIGLLGILKAGAVYLPISSGYPDARINFMLEDSGTKILLTTSKLADKVSFSGKMICLDDKTNHTGNGLSAHPQPDDPAYVIYTSGSTGKPKGVIVEHRALVNRLHWMQKKYPISRGDVILQKTPFTFDVSLWELLWWALEGASLYYLKPGDEKDPRAIIDAVEAGSISIIHFVPSMLTAFLNHLENRKTEKERLRTLNHVFCSGEALLPEQVERFNRLKIGAKLHNLYGPTEAAVDVTYFDCPGDNVPALIPIGKPIDNIRLYILGKNGGLQPVGIPGELHIAGTGLAQGYLNRPGLTEEKFVPNPYEENGLIYKTGDLARLLPDGNIEYLGRLDNQVKIRGFRIELGEIEGALIKKEDITECIVSVKKDSNGEPYICAYIVSPNKHSYKDLKAWLAADLPAYMIPSHFIPMESLPLTANGKVDRKRLPEPDKNGSSGTAYVPPTSENEKKLTLLWSRSLGIDKIGIDDNFFELGGHSLKAAGILAKISALFGVDIKMSTFFDSLTIRSLVDVIQRKKENNNKESFRHKIIKPTPFMDKYPASAAEHRLYVLYRLEGKSVAYNLPGGVMISGQLNKDRLEKVFQQLIQRHESLRTTFFMEGEKTFRIIHEELPIKINYTEGKEVDFDRIITDFIRPFDPEKGPLMHVELAALDSGKNLLLFDFHHIIADGVSSVILVDEFIKLYMGESLPELTVQYKDFSLWQNDFFLQPEVKKQEAFWLERFKGEIPVLNIPTDFSRPLTRSYEGKKKCFTLDATLVESAESFARKKGASLYMVLLGAYYTLLHRYSGQDDIVVGSPTAGRGKEEAENLIGMFVNTLALRNFPEGTKSFSSFLDELKVNVLQALENQDYQFDLLVEKIEIPRDGSRSPLFDTMFVLQNMALPPVEIENLRFSPCKVEAGVSKFDLTFEVVELDKGFQLNIEYCTKLFKEERIEKMFLHFCNILQEGIDNPEVLLGDINMLTFVEKKKLLEEYNNTMVEYPNTKTIPLIFEENVNKEPDNIAAQYGNKFLTFAELNRRAASLGRILQNKGLQRGRCAAMMLERSLDMITGIMGIFKAGGAYLPISPDYPEERIEFMLADSKTNFLLTTREFRDKVKFSGEILCLDDEELYTADEEDFCSLSMPDDPAYIIYTSGSTGKPKGVVIEHKALVNRLHWMQKEYPLGKGDVILQKTPYTFDVSVWELLLWSLGGAMVNFLKPGGEKDPSAIADAIKSASITTLHFVPSMLQAFLDWLEQNRNEINKLNSLRRVFSSGEALSPDLVFRFYKLFDKKVKLVNLYGPTEAVIDVTFYNCQPGEKQELIPIGKPIDNIRLYILNSNNRLQPEGVAGELHIAGEGLAREYLNRDKLTAEKFISNPYEPGGRLYKTGDLARWLPDGNVEYLGRRDNQVKIRGFRIELGEIETELRTYKDIKECVVCVKKDDRNNIICAYIVTKRELSVKELRNHLSRTLPEYMIPSYFIELERLPLTPNGKLDRSALPDPEKEINTGNTYVAPTTEVEKQLAKIWTETLGVDRISVKDRFFELGGYSILLIQMHSKMEKLYPGVVKITDVFAYPTIADLAGYIETSRNKTVLILNAITMPPDYFTSGGELNRDNFYRFKLEGALYENLKKMALKENVDMAHVSAALFGYLFAQLSGSVTPEIQTALMEHDKITPLSFELDKIESIAQLIAYTGEKIKTSEITYSPADLLDNRGIKRGQHGILPLLYCRGMLSAPKGFDIIFELKNESEALEITCEYDSSRLKKDKMKDFINHYIQLADIVIQKYEEESVTVN